MTGETLTLCYAERGHRRTGHASMVFVHGFAGSKVNWNSIVDVRTIYYQVIIHSFISRNRGCFSVQGTGILFTKNSI